MTFDKYGLHQVHNYSFKWKNYKKLSLTDNSEKTLSNLVCTFFVHKNIECILNKMNNFELKVHFICQWNTAKKIPVWSPMWVTWSVGQLFFHQIWRRQGQWMSPSLNDYDVAGKERLSQLKGSEYIPLLLKYQLCIIEFPSKFHKRWWNAMAS